MTDQQIERIGLRLTPYVMELALLIIGFRLGEIETCKGWKCEQPHNYVAGVEK